MRCRPRATRLEASALPGWRRPRYPAGSSVARQRSPAAGGVTARRTPPSAAAANGPPGEATTDERPPMIHVCPLSRLEETVAATGARHLVSAVDAAHVPARPAAVADHIVLPFNDIAAARPGLVAPAAAHVEALLAFVDRWGAASPLVVHCWAGISRSPAVAFVVACLLEPDRPEAEIAWELRFAAPTATPNPGIVALADTRLGRGGRMSAAIAAIGRGADAFEGAPFHLAIGSPAGGPAPSSPGGRTDGGAR